jgi:kumamolisin
MSQPEEYVPLPGSEQALTPGAHLLGVADPQEVIEVTVRVRPRAAHPRPAEGEPTSIFLVHPHHQVGREGSPAASSADPIDLVRVEAFARAQGLHVREVSVPRRRLVLSGSGRALSAAFRVSLERYEIAGARYRAAIGPVRLPAELAPLVEAVVGLDSRPSA